MKRVFGIIISLLLICLNFIFVGCSDDEKELRGGFGANSDITSPIQVAFVADRTVIKQRHDLTVKLYYGRVGSLGDLPQGTTVSAVVTMKRFLYDENRKDLELLEEQVVTTIDNFSDNFYDWDNVVKNDSTVGVENIVIQYDLFEGDNGAISWDVVSTTIFPDDRSPNELTESGGTTLYYVKQNGKVYLFGNYNDFYKFR